MTSAPGATDTALSTSTASARRTDAAPATANKIKSVQRLAFMVGAENTFVRRGRRALSWEGGRRTDRIRGNRL